MAEGNTAGAQAFDGDQDNEPIVQSLNKQSARAEKEAQLALELPPIKSRARVPPLDSYPLTSETERENQLSRELSNSEPKLPMDDNFLAYKLPWESSDSELPQMMPKEVRVPPVDSYPLTSEIERENQLLRQLSNSEPKLPMDDYFLAYKLPWESSDSELPQMMPKEVAQVSDHKMLKRSSNTTQKIQKVPFLLKGRENFSKLFEPRIISFGPIHHGEKPEQYEEAEYLKEDWKKSFTENNAKNEAELYDTIVKEIEQLRKCYKTGMVDKYNNGDLAGILLKDGCAILYYIYCKVKKIYDTLHININQVAFVEQDMFLLENQVPFQVLGLLIGPSDQAKKTWRKRIRQFICKTSVMSTLLQGRNIVMEDDSEWDEEPTHLLALLRKNLFQFQQVGKNQQHQNGNEVRISVSKSNPRERDNENDWESYRCAIDLKESGINFKAKNSRFLNDISFTQHWISGTLEIPPITIDDSTGPLFMNLIAYELCPDFRNDFAVSSYIWFLDTIIDYPEDVKELRNAHVLRNFLGSDEEVSQLFNEMATDLVPNDRLYKTVTQGIQRHYDHPWWPMLAKFYYTHFNTPWTAIAFFAALVVFVLTGTQTYYTIWPRN